MFLRMRCATDVTLLDAYILSVVLWFFSYIPYFPQSYSSKSLIWPDWIREVMWYSTQLLPSLCLVSEVEKSCAPLLWLVSDLTCMYYSVVYVGFFVIFSLHLKTK